MIGNRKENIMKYEIIYTHYDITFKALTAPGEEVGLATLRITTCRQLDLQRKHLSFKRMCLEYARCIGYRCSDVEIISVEEKLLDEGAEPTHENN